MKLRVGALILLTACGGSDGNGPDAGPPKPDAPPDAPPIQSGTVAITLQSVDALTYLAPLTLGGSQHQSVIVDTGSTTLGVAGSSCSSCGVDPKYTPGSGAVDQHKTAQAQFGDGTGWNGEIFQDSTQLGTASTVPVKFASITSSSGFFRSLDGGPIPYQGIMGMGPDGALLAGTTSYVTQAIAAGMNAVFAFQLCPDTGTLWLGGVDPAAEASAPQTTPMLSGIPFYTVHVADIDVDGTSIGLSSSQLGPTIIDTGTSISFVPKAAVTAIASKVSGSAGYKAVFGNTPLTDMGCVTTTMTGTQIDAMLPPLHVTFDGASKSGDLPATKSYLVFNGGNSWCFAFSDSAQVFGQGLTVSLYGDSLLASFTTTFDVGNSQMGFANEAGCHETNFAPAAARPAPTYVPGIPWWKQDARVRLPSPEMVQRLHEVLGVQ